MTATRVYIYPQTVTLDNETCIKCGVIFGIEVEFHKRLRNDRPSKNFYCTNGHPMIYDGETEAGRLARELNQVKDDISRVRADRDQIEASRRAFKGQATRLRNRAIAGQCPVCGESVYQLGRHMARKHPDEQPEEEV